MESKYHTRSNSFPSASHPTSTRIEQELSKSKTWEATFTSTSKSIGTGLFFLEDLYICLEDLLNMASTQKIISQHQGEKCMEELLDCSVTVLDICGITRDTLLQIKENVQSLQSSLRRRKGDSSIEKSVAEYNFFSKNMKKNASKLLTSLKKMDEKFGVSPLLIQDHQLIKVLMEVIGVNMSIFQSLLSFLVVPSSKSKATKWFSKMMHKGVISCEEKNEDVNELQCVEASLTTLLRDSTNVVNIKAAHQSLEALEYAIESLENGLETVLRHLLKTRATLLNIMTQ